MTLNQKLDVNSVSIKLLDIYVDIFYTHWKNMNHILFEKRHLLDYFVRPSMKKTHELLKKGFYCKTQDLSAYLESIHEVQSPK